MAGRYSAISKARVRPAALPLQGAGLQINVEAFYWKYTDKQETIAGYDGCGSPSCGGQRTNLTVNAGNAELYGLSADLTYRITRKDTFRFAGEYNHSEYKSFQLLSPGGAVNTGCRQTPSGIYTILDCSGFPLTRAPRWSGNADYQHAFDFADGHLTFGASAYYASSRYLDATFLGMLKAPPYAMANADLTYAPDKGRWSVTGYIRNIGNKAAPVTAYALATSATAPFVASAVLNPPRTYGIRGSIDF